MKDVPRTFSSLASYVFQLVKSAASQDRTRTDLIMDQYPDVSIKNPERERRGAVRSIQIAINHGNQKCPTQWKKYLSDGSNKANIASFLLQKWQKPEYFVRFADFGSLFVTHGMECHKLTAGENAINCKQEEADTRILLHTSHAASNGHDCIAIKSPIQMWRSLRAHSVTALMPWYYSVLTRSNEGGTLNDCHWTIAWWRCVQSTAWNECFNRMWQHKCIREKRQKAGAHYGRVRPKHVRCPNDVRPRRWTAARMCSVRMLTVWKQREDTDRVRYKLFCSKNAQTCHLPPTKDALKYHVARANYQACIWHNSLEAGAHMPSPHGHGWDVIDVTYPFTGWTSSLYQRHSCNSSVATTSNGGRCSCRKNVMSCTDACSCIECSNTQDIGRTQNDSSDEDEEWTNHLVDT